MLLKIPAPVSGYHARDAWLSAQGPPPPGVPKGEYPRESRLQTAPGDRLDESWFTQCSGPAVTGFDSAPARWLDKYILASRSEEGPDWAGGMGQS